MKCAEENEFQKRIKVSDSKILLRITRCNSGKALQIVMNYHRGGGLNLKGALQFAALLAMFIWLLYQINYPLRKTTLGRKVNMGSLTPDSNGAKIITKSRNGEGAIADDQLAKSQEAKKPEINAMIYGQSMKGKDAMVAFNKTGELNSGLDSGFDDENGVPPGLDDVTESQIEEQDDDKVRRG